MSALSGILGVMEETLICTVHACQAHGTEALVRRGFTVCYVCPEHHAQITSDLDTGAAKWVLSHNLMRTSVLSIVRQAA